MKGKHGERSSTHGCFMLMGLNMDHLLQHSHHENFSLPLLGLPEVQEIMNFAADASIDSSRI